MSLIIKRKGNAELFSEEKLKRSLQRVFQVTNSELSQEVFKEIMLRLSIQDGMSTRQLQTQVENVLMGLRCFEQARYYIIYRHINYHSRMMTDRVQFMRSYLSAINPATGSKYDANANVTVKNVTTLSGELFKGDIIALNRYRLHEMIQNLYGKDLADEYIYMLEHHFLYKHDESSIAPYCVSITMYPFLLHGLRPLGGLSSQPKGIDSFCGGFINLVFAVSSLFAGAVATGEFLMYFDYFARKDFGEDYMDQMNEFYTIGPKLRAFIKKTDVAFKNFIDVTDFIRYDFQDEDLNKERDELVESLTRSATQEELKNWYESCTQNGVFQWAPLKLGDGSRTLGAYLTQLFQQVVYSMNQPAAARSYQSVFWNISYFDKYYFEGLFGGFYFPDGTAPVWKSLQKLQKVFMKWFNRERTKEVITFPVESFALLTDKDDAHYLDEDSADFVAEMQAEGHSFFVYTSNDPDALASCCRLRNEVLDNSFSYSLGAGGIATGSKSVMTLNLNRLIQEARRKNVNYVDYLRDTVRKVHKFQIAFNELIKEFFKEGALPVYDAGYISMDKQFLTIGVNGAVEAAEFLGMKANPKCKEYQEFINSILEVFYTENKKARTKELMFNTEFVPAENLGVKHYKWDKEDGYVVPENRECYNSYFYAVEDESLTIVDKFKLHGKEFVKYLDGGSALHMNLSEHLTKAQYRKLLDVAAKEGTNYFTYNIPNTICNKCGHIDKRYLKKCPECGSEDIDYATRVIGYLKRISNFSKARQIEAGQRAYYGSDKLPQETVQ